MGDGKRNTAWVGIFAATLLMTATIGCASPQDRGAAMRFAAEVEDLAGVVDVEAKAEWQFYGTETPVQLTVEPRGAEEVAGLVREILAIEEKHDLAGFGLSIVLADSPVTYAVSPESLKEDLVLAHDLALTDLGRGVGEVDLTSEQARFEFNDAERVSSMVRELTVAGHQGAVKYWDFHVTGAADQEVGRDDVYPEGLSLQVEGKLTPDVLRGWEEFAAAVKAHEPEGLRQAAYSWEPALRPSQPRQLRMYLEVRVDEPGDDFSMEKYGQAWWPLLDPLAGVSRRWRAELYFTVWSRDLDVGFVDLIRSGRLNHEFVDTRGWQREYELRRDGAVR